MQAIVSNRCVFAIEVFLLFVGAAHAQSQFVELEKAYLPLASDSTAAFVLGDVDKDGDLDLVQGGYGQNKLYLNDGRGRFSDATATNMPKEFLYTSALALGDVDGDRDLDLVCGNYGNIMAGGMPNSLYLNDGKGKFTNVTGTKMPKIISYTWTNAVALDDVDGDGDLDLVSGNSGQNTLYLNDGKGTFTDATVQRLPKDSDTTLALALVDVDKDSDLDIVCGNGTYGVQNRLYLNDGKGKFTDVTAQRLPKDSDMTAALAHGDVDGDGDLDLVCGNVGSSSSSSGGQNRLYLNDGRGKFTDATGTKLPRDTDWTEALALGDVDGDGDLDLVCGNYGGQNRLYVNDSKGKFTDATATKLPRDTATTRALVLGDLDGDGDRDLLCGNDGYYRLVPNRLYMNEGNGKFTDVSSAHAMPEDGDATYALALGDVDGDGDRDLVCGNHLSFVYGTQNRLYLNDGKGTFTDATAQRLPKDSGTTLALALGDVDKDGDLDIVCGNGTYGVQNRLWLNDGKGKFTDVTAQRLPKDSDMTAALALGDVDGDGALDLVCGNYGGQNRLYLNDGKGKFMDATATKLPRATDWTEALVLGDVDGDGDLDLVCGNTGSSWSGGQNRLYLNDGKGTFTDATAQRLPKDIDPTLAVALGDVDKDGDIDIVCGNAGSSWSSGQNRLYLNDGKGTFTDATALTMPKDTDWTRALALGDVDGDGDRDIVCGNDSSSIYPKQNKLYLNDGKGTFTDATATKMPNINTGISAIALDDVDGDGDRDLVCVTAGKKLYLNSLRHVAAPYFPSPGRTYHLDFYARPGFATTSNVALPFVALAEIRQPVPPLGIFWLDLQFTIQLLPVVIPSPAGVASIQFPIPNDPQLIGLTLSSQALMLHAPTLFHLTNATSDLIRRL